MGGGVLILNFNSVNCLILRENILAARQIIAAPSRRLGGSGSTAAGSSGSEEPGIYTLIIYSTHYT